MIAEDLLIAFLGAAIMGLAIVVAGLAREVKELQDKQPK